MAAKKERQRSEEDAESSETSSESKAGGSRAAGRPVWTGSISFGLVTIPVRLFIAVREQTIHFRSLHDQDQVPIKQKLVCPADGTEVHREHIVKGYEIEKDHFVVVRQDELDAVAPKATKAIEIQDFVDLGEIDPIFFERAYFVAPKPEGAKPYRLLLEAMANAKKVGIARIVMHNKEYLAALRPVENPDTADDALMLETMHFGDEVVPASAIGDLRVSNHAKVDDRELKIAKQLIDTLTTSFDPARYHDDYREKVMAMIHEKAEGKHVVSRPEQGLKPHRGADLMAALEASLVRTKGSRRRKSA